jgi:FKBP-type peptidyl-prolyl cis-trans isomerase
MNNLFKIFSAILFAVLLVGCEEKYTDTKDAGDAFLGLHAKKKTETLTYTNIETGEEKTVEAPIKVLSDGLQYAFFYENPYGKFPSTDIINYVTITYTGYFINGEVFESGTKVAIYSNLIYGLQEVIGKMRIGSMCRVWIPQNLAFGKDGNDSPKIDPYTALYYDILLQGAY